MSAPSPAFSFAVSLVGGPASEEVGGEGSAGVEEGGGERVARTRLVTTAETAALSSTSSSSSIEGCRSLESNEVAAVSSATRSVATTCR